MTAIHQASYFAWQGLLNKINSSDTFIFLDEVQFTAGAYQNRNLFLDKSGTTKMLTIALQTKGHLQTNIKEMKIHNRQWQKKHLKFLMQNYNKHPFYEEILEEIMPIYTKEYIFVIDTLFDSLQILCKLFDIQTKIVKQSDLEYERDLKKNDLIISLLQGTKSKTYLSGIGAKSYQNDERFVQEDIKLFYQEYQQKEYTQLHSSTFVRGLSSLDLLFNHGKKNASKYI